MERIAPKLLFLVRILLLIVFLAGLGGLIVWTCYPDKVDELDSFIVGRYETCYSTPVTEALKLASRGHDSGAVRLLEEALKPLNDIRNRDRLWPVKRKAFNVLTNLYSREGRLDKARYLLGVWLSIDKNDLVARHKYARLLLSMPQYREAGSKIITEIYLAFPGFGNVFSDYFILKEKNMENTSMLLQ